jgi:hypothetical protein
MNSDDKFSSVLIALLRGVVYRETDAALWQNLIDLQARVRDYLNVIRLELIIDEVEGYSYLKQRVLEPDERELPRLVVRRQLGYTASLLLVLLRKQLAEFDAHSSEARLIVTREEVIDLIRIFLPETSNEAKLLDRVDRVLEQVEHMGFLHRLRAGEEKFEVRRILKAFVDAQWLHEFEQKLAEYHRHAQAEAESERGAV